MTGTASELYGINENSNLDLNGFDLFSRWLFEKSSSNLILQDINQHGCIVHMPISQTTPLDVFKLIIMSPNDSEKVHTIINAQVHWMDSEALPKYKKLSIQFVNMDDSLCDEINALQQYLNINSENKISCSVLNC